MKLILDCPPALMGTAMNFFFNTQPQNPQQKPGRGNSVKEKRGEGIFELIRNADSYTVKVTTK